MNIVRLKRVIQMTLVVWALGVLALFFYDREDSLWFAIGGGLALVNLIFAYFVVKRGLGSLPSKGVFLGLLATKSLSFLAVIVLVLMVLKPRVLPFTLGLGLVMVGAVVVAVGEALRLIRSRGR